MDVCKLYASVCSVFSVADYLHAEELGARRGSEGREGGVDCPMWLIKAESCALLQPTVSSSPPTRGRRRMPFSISVTLKK